MSTSLVFFTVSDLRLVTARHILSEAGIESFILNKRDSMHPGVFPGNTELYVNKEDKEKAKQLLEAEDMLIQ